MKGPMQIELNQKEIEMLDDALVTWQKQPTTDGFGKAIFSTMIRGLAKREGEESALSPEDDPKAIHAQAELESKGRERKVLLLRAKLAQASAVASEHEVA